MMNIEFRELRKVIDQSIDIYNNKRPHLALGMKTPRYILQKTAKLASQFFD